MKRPVSPGSFGHPRLRCYFAASGYVGHPARDRVAAVQRDAVRRRRAFAVRRRCPGERARRCRRYSSTCPRSWTTSNDQRSRCAPRASPSTTQPTCYAGATSRHTTDRGRPRSHFRRGQRRAGVSDAAAGGGVGAGGRERRHDRCCGAPATGCVLPPLIGHPACDQRRDHRRGRANHLRLEDPGELHRAVSGDRDWTSSPMRARFSWARPTPTSSRWAPAPRTRPISPRTTRGT